MRENEIETPSIRERATAWDSGVRFLERGTERKAAKKLIEFIEAVK